MNRRLKPELQIDIETEREADGRWIAEVPNIPAAMAYGKTKEQAKNKAKVVASRVLATSPAHTSNTAPHQSP